MRRGLVLAALILGACGSVALPAEIGPDFDLGGVLDDLRDCDALSETFVAVVREAAEDLDNLSDASGGLVPAAELAEKVDVLTGNAYFDIAERLGCNAVAQRVDTIDRLRNLTPDSAAGEDLVTEVIRELEAQSG